MLVYSKRTMSILFATRPHSVLRLVCYDLFSIFLKRWTYLENKEDTNAASSAPAALCGTGRSWRQRWHVWGKLLSEGHWACDWGFVAIREAAEISVLLCQPAVLLSFLFSFFLFFLPFFLFFLLLFPLPHSSFFCPFGTARVIWEKRTSIVEMPPLD